MLRLRMFARSRSLGRLRVATYYTKAKKKKKASGQAWLLFAGVTTSIVGGAVCVLGKWVRCRVS